MSAAAGKSEGITRRLAEFSAGLTWEALPGDVRLKVKHLILDSLGATLAATTLGAGCRESVEVMRNLGGAPESTIFGCADKVAAPHAAFANGALGHALNYDPIGADVGHVGVVCLAAPLAMAEAAGAISGRRFLTAAAVAAEVTARVTAAITRTGRRPSEKFLAGQLLGFFGAAAGAGRVLGLRTEQMHSALGLALMQASGSMQVTRGGDPPAKAIYGAFPNHGGVLAALLARSGLGATIDALEGDAGLYGMLYRGEVDPGPVVEGLGRDFLLMRTQFKPWPTSTETYPFIEAACRIGRLPAAAIKEVVISGPGVIRTWVEPLAIRAKPPNGAAAANSIPFSVAKALCHGSLTLADFTEQGIQDRDAIAVAQRTRYSLDDAIEGGIVEVATTEGKVLRGEIRVPHGHPSRPVPYGNLVAKFKDCCRYAKRPLSAGQVERLIGMIESLESLDNIRKFSAAANGAA
jgi:2-methylcitrate dehydratase PrpD